jgi:hypothetical protein
MTLSLSHVAGLSTTHGNDRSAFFIKLSRKCGSAPEQISSDSRSTGVLHSGVSCGLFFLFFFCLFRPGELRRRPL